MRVKTVCLSYLSYYKMSTTDVEAYLQEKGIDINRDFTVHHEGDGAAIIYSQEVVEDEGSK